MDRIKPQVTSVLINLLPDSTSNSTTSEHANQMENLISHQESPKPNLGQLSGKVLQKSVSPNFRSPEVGIGRVCIRFTCRFVLAYCVQNTTYIT